MNLSFSRSQAEQGQLSSLRGSAVTIRPMFSTGGVSSKIADKTASPVQPRTARPTTKIQDADISRRPTRIGKPARQSAYPIATYPSFTRNNPNCCMRWYGLA